MTRLRDIMTADVHAVSSDATLQELAEFFTEENVSGAPVLDGEKLVGVVSVTDLIEFDADGRGVPRYEAIETDEFNEEARDPAAPTAPGFFTDPWDDARVRVRSRLSAGGALWSSLQDQTVADVMTRDLLTMPATAEVGDAARSMMKAGVHRLLVMEGADLAGVVTTTDIVRAVARYGLGSKDSD